MLTLSNIEQLKSLGYHFRFNLGVLINTRESESIPEYFLEEYKAYVIKHGTDPEVRLSFAEGLPYHHQKMTLPNLLGNLKYHPTMKYVLWDDKDISPEIAELNTDTLTMPKVWETTTYFNKGTNHDYKQ